jgi:hypothetical protein
MRTTMSEQPLDRSYERLHSELVDLGLCYEPGQVAISPLLVGAPTVQTWSHELPALLALARRIAHDTGTGPGVAVPETHRTLARAYEGRPCRPGIMRPDGIIVGQQLKLLEMNVDSALGGLWEVEFLQSLLAQNPALRVPASTRFHSTKQAMRTFITGEVAALGDELPATGPIDIALVGFSDFDRLYVDLTQEICKWLSADRRIRATYTTPEQLRCGEHVTDGVRRFHLLYRFGALVHSVRRCAPMLDLLRAAATTRTLILSDPRDLMIEHKGILAQLSELADQPDALSSSDRELVHRYVPWSRIVRRGPVTFGGASADLHELAVALRKVFVLKRAQSHAGEHVFIGAETAAAEWRDLLERAHGDALPWVLQENVASSLHAFEYYMPGEGTMRVPRRYTVSPYFFGELFAGSLVRVEQDPARRVLALPYNSAMGVAGMATVPAEAA